MSWATLRPEIQTLIGQISGIAEVSALPKTDFDGFPAVTITPSDLSSDYETATENLRVYAFQVRVFYRPQGSETVGDAIDAVEETVDAIIDKLDKEGAPGVTRTIGAGLPANSQILDIEPVIGPWGYSQDLGMVVAEVSVRIKISFDISS